ncbi:MAG: hypothetical protein C3F13_01470 [Anaerolineales bacterium]|nr:hypothetical protein [Anaerolineae bacterium]PWB56235.1 MAG: hypothetical protein C3F13_01470 [Anaerolineales bacterium]
MAENPAEIFNGYKEKAYSQYYEPQEITVDDGHNYLRSLMERDKRHVGHPMDNEENGKFEL